jgi:hypothetical protein
MEDSVHYARDNVHRELFYASTVISFGNGKLTPVGRLAGSMVYHPNSWLPTSTGKHFKHRSVHQELNQFSWIKNLRSIDSEELMDEFFLLFHTLGEVHLLEERDTIAGKWTAIGEYMAASAYEVQFLVVYLRY